VPEALGPPATVAAEEGPAEHTEVAAAANFWENCSSPGAPTWLAAA
jgi:hypothetical protein